MTTFTINEQNEIVAFSTLEEASAATQTPFDSFASDQELAELAAAWPAGRLLAVLNSLPGEKPVKKLKDPKTAIGRIWARVQDLGEAAKPEPKVTKPEVVPAKGKAIKKVPAAKNAPKAKKAAKAQEAAAPRDGSKMSQVVAMLQRKHGATLVEIMVAMSWQRHTVRGSVAGALKKAGYTVESFNPEGGERTYRINKQHQAPPIRGHHVQVIGPLDHTPSRRHWNEREPNVAQQWPNPAAASTPQTSLPAPGTDPANRDARPGSVLRWLRSRAGSGRFKLPPFGVHRRCRRRSARRLPAWLSHPSALATASPPLPRTSDRAQCRSKRAQ
jgi:hypothetical protein